MDYQMVLVITIKNQRHRLIIVDVVLFGKYSDVRAVSHMGTSWLPGTIELLTGAGPELLIER